MRSRNAMTRPNANPLFFVASLLALSLTSFSASAASVAYDFVADAFLGCPEPCSLEITITFDEALIQPIFSSIESDEFTAWKATWTIGGQTFSQSSAAGDLLVGTFIELTSELVTGGFFCTDACNDGTPYALVVPQGNSALISNGIDGDYLSTTGAWSGPRAVPIPASVALLSFALGGLTLLQRRRTR